MRAKGLWRSQQDCRMGQAMNAEFCPACKILLKRRLTGGGAVQPACLPQEAPATSNQTPQNQAPPSQTAPRDETAAPETYAQLMVTVFQDTRLRIEGAADVRGPTRPAVDASPYIYAVKLDENAKWMFGESLPDDLFTQRGYGPAASREGHGVAAVSSSLVKLRVVGMTTAQLQGAANLQIAVYRLTEPQVALSGQAVIQGTAGGMAPRIDDWIASKSVELVAIGKGLQGQIK